MFRYLGHIMTADYMDEKDIKNRSGGKMELAICWSGSFYLHILSQKSNCSSPIVRPFMDMLFGVIHTRTVVENLLSVLVTHSSVLLTSPDTPAWVCHLRWTQLTISMLCSPKFAYSLMSRVTASLNIIVSAIVNCDAYHQSPLIDNWESMLYVYRNNHR